jgi:hypothetical protein
VPATATIAVTIAVVTRKSDHARPSSAGQNGASLRRKTRGRYAAPPFNGLFYATCATIIPVLFLALIVPGGTIAYLTKQMEAGVGDDNTGVIKAALAAGLAGVIIVFAGLAEITAIIALGNRGTDISNQGGITASTILLIITVVAGPLCPTSRLSSPPSPASAPGRQTAATQSHPAHRQQQTSLKAANKTTATTKHPRARRPRNAL